MEAKIAQAAGLEFRKVSAGKFRRYHGRRLIDKLLDLKTFWLNFHDIGRFLLGVIQSRKIIREYEPDVIFIKGGYVGLPVGLAAKALKIPYVIHESDTLPGLTNRWLAKGAAKIAVGFPVDKYKLPADKLVYTGSPIRAELLSSHRLEGIKQFKLNPKLPVVLVVGGSQGARVINECVMDALPELTSFTQIIHVTGEQEIERVRFEVKRLGLVHPDRYQAHSFLAGDMGGALQAADLVVSRAGANAIAELAALAKPTILIPNPRLTGGHQVANAMVLARRGAVRVIGEEHLKPAVLVGEIKKVIDSDEEHRYLSEHIQQFAVFDADVRLAKLILSAALPRTEVADAPASN